MLLSSWSRAAWVLLQAGSERPSRQPPLFSDALNHQLPGGRFRQILRPAPDAAPALFVQVAAARTTGADQWQVKGPLHSGVSREETGAPGVNRLPRCCPFEGSHGRVGCSQPLIDMAWGCRLPRPALGLGLARAGPRHPTQQLHLLAPMQRAPKSGDGACLEAHRRCSLLRAILSRLHCLTPEQQQAFEPASRGGVSKRPCSFSSGSFLPITGTLSPPDAREAAARTPQWSQSSQIHRVGQAQGSSIC